MPIERVLRVVKYKHVYDSSRPALKLNGTSVEDLRAQLNELRTDFEIASIEASVDFLTGEYRPRRDLCLLTFDDSLKDHLQFALPVLLEQRIRGVFFLITSCVEERTVAPIHMHDLLISQMGADEYAERFRKTVLAIRPDAFSQGSVYDSRAIERLDDAAGWPYVFHAPLDPEVRDSAIRQLFRTHVGSEEELAASLYLSWNDARQMQKAGMSMGGQAHQHKLLSTLTASELIADLECCRRLLARNLAIQPLLPFAYPGGRKESFHVRAVRKLRELGFGCAFSTESGDNRRGTDVFTIGRTECMTTMRVFAGGA
jgi:peptidoglycan/xylan/chitin deacetylase (PgdA/CDA1 family)